MAHNEREGGFWSMYPKPIRLAVWDPATLDDMQGQRALTTLTRQTPGFDALQLRVRRARPPSAVLRRIADAAKTQAVAIWINRNFSLAQALDADGIQLGADAPADSYAQARAAGLAFAISVHHINEARRAAAHNPAFLLAGHVRATPSHPGVPGRGWSWLRRLSAAVSVPVIAIGGLRWSDVDAATHAGACGVAALRAAFSHAPHRDAAKEPPPAT